MIHRRICLQLGRALGSVGMILSRLKDLIIGDLVALAAGVSVVLRVCI